MQRNHIYLYDKELCSHIFELCQCFHKSKLVFLKTLSLSRITETNIILGLIFNPSNFISSVLLLKVHKLLNWPEDYM